jgi:hypothetical protein
MHFLPTCESNNIELVNRVDRLTLSNVDTQRLHQFATYNKLMNYFVLRICFCSNGKILRKATLQIFLSTHSAMCFTRHFKSDMYCSLFSLLHNKYGVQVTLCKLCTSVWTYQLLCRVGDLGKFYSFLCKVIPHTKIDYNPELFPCITIEFKNFHSVTTFARIFHTGKVVLLGVRSLDQIGEVVPKLSNLYFDYSLQCNLDNFS